VKMDAKGYVDIPVVLPVPERFGGYVAVVELPELGRCFAAAMTRIVPLSAPGKVQDPSYALDIPSYYPYPEPMQLFQRTGIKGIRIEWGYYPTTQPDFDQYMSGLHKLMDVYMANDIAVLWTVNGSASGPHVPTGAPRPWLNDKNEMQNTKSDYAWMPSYDKDFQKFIATMIGQYGWPKGPINAVELWNEPWEGISISGWGADMIRYREIYEHMALGVEEAREKAGVKVLIGGACSTMNTEDKLFGDGSDKFLKWLDFTSIHYQPLASWGTLKPEWMNRTGAYGPVRVWDTESWFANTEGLIVGAIASMRAQGQLRTAGVLHDASYDFQHFNKRTSDGDVPAVNLHSWNNMAAIASMQSHIGERTFKEILFKNGLPWVFVFDGLKNEDDGCVVVLGNFEQLLEPEKALYHTVTFAPDAAIVLADNGKIRLYDAFGNVIPAENKKITVPLGGQAFIVGTDKSKGSMAALLEAITKSDIRGIEPVRFEARDMMANIDSKPTIRLTVANNINRPVKGTLSVTVDGCVVQAPADVALEAYEAREMTVQVVSGKVAADNAYPMVVTFDGGKDGRVVHKETMRVNVISRKTITVDGELSDWEGVLPQVVVRDGSTTASMTEKAWFPFMKFDAGVTTGVAVAYMAYDDDYFYIATRVVDTTPYKGNVRFETRDDDQYFYPAEDVAWIQYKNWDDNTEVRREIRKWPEGVRRYSYRKGPDIPSGDGTDNLQLGFNVVPADKKPMMEYAKGTMPRFQAYFCTDYEFAFNKVAAAYGGGTEVWRLTAPGIPMKHYYPRQPKAPVDGGPVKAAKLVMTHEGNTRILEAALPWSEIPLVKEKMLKKEPIKLTFRINDNGGSAFELSARRSVSKINTYALHDFWASSWATEVEFAFE